MLEEYLSEKSEYVNNKLVEFLPQEIDEGWFSKHFFDTEVGIMNEIFRPIWDLLGRGGKRWRPILMLLCCDAIGGGSKIEDLIPIVEVIHNGTLMVDDVEDNSDIRRGKPCTHKIFGVDVAINTGNLMYYLPYLILKKVDLDKKTKLKIYELIYEEMLNLSVGQGMDIYWHSGGEKINEELYLKMCALKTGTLARMSAKIGAIMGHASKRQVNALGSFAESLGIAFQIQDDILNITNEGWGKELGDDISEGKKSLMVIKTLEWGKEEDKSRLIEILNLKTKDGALIKEAIGIIKRYNTIEYAKKKAKRLVENAWKKVDRYIEDSESKEKLKLFKDYVVDRSI